MVGRAGATPGDQRKTRADHVVEPSTIGQQWIRAQRAGEPARSAGSAHQRGSDAAPAWSSRPPCRADRVSAAAGAARGGAPRRPRGRRRSSPGRRPAPAESCGGCVACVPARRCPGRLRPSVPSWTPAIFQARFIASRTPAPMPWPMNGGVRCAASPRRKTLPRRQRSAICARNVYSVTRSSVRSLSATAAVHGAISGRSASKVPKSSALSPGEQLELPAVAGRVRCACRCPRGPGRTPGARRPTGRRSAVGGDVDHQPALLEVQIPHGGADLGAHHAVGAVAAQHVVGVDLVNLAVGCGR